MYVFFKQLNRTSVESDRMEAWSTLSLCRSESFYLHVFQPQTFVAVTVWLGASDFTAPATNPEFYDSMDFTLDKVGFDDITKII